MKKIYSMLLIGIMVLTLSMASGCSFKKVVEIPDPITGDVWGVMIGDEIYQHVESTAN